MTKILAIAWKDLRSTLRNVPALVMMLAAPLALAALLGFAFGGSGGFDIAATKVVVANLDKGGADAGQNAGAAIQSILTSKDLKDVLETSTRSSEVAAQQAVDDGKAAVAVIVPQDFSAVVFGSDPAATSQVELYENPTSEIGGSIVEGVVGQVLADFNGARAAAAGAVALASQGNDPADPQMLAASAAGQFSHSGGVSAGLRISQRSPQAGATEKEVSVTGSILSGMMIFFMFFGAANVARTILTEDRDGTMPRLFTTPTRHGLIIGGKFVAVFLTVLLQAIVLLIAGRLIFGIQWGRLDAVVLLTVVAAGVAGGLALLVISFAKTPAQAGAIGSGIYLVLALLGGNFTGTAQTSGVYGVVQKFTPNGWLIEGWDTTLRGGGALDIRWQVLVPLGFAVAFFFFAVLRMRRRFA
ncbi:MAG: ABC transporter permease [Actinobacteria bacterium]|nr:ABC transporter permease [Actinomycetota bacterium]